ncbi:hypothetical protein BJ508DRAFT_377248 [Ascobolus immersus RN42]|uniref:Uncharacterized protein n=1 Tax=Ascobolus immersus RN42 TaxID=1160509 RepID=A0A3N4IEN0_ASCIM|nr:hypothetical protein BJ508DRAFT_377248 [Ascobolus immersus RN42]
MEPASDLHPKTTNSVLHPKTTLATNNRKRTADTAFTDTVDTSSTNWLFTWNYTLHRCYACKTLFPSNTLLQAHLEFVACEPKPYPGFNPAETELKFKDNPNVTWKQISPCPDMILINSLDKDPKHKAFKATAFKVSSGVLRNASFAFRYRLGHRSREEIAVSIRKAAIELNSPLGILETEDLDDTAIEYALRIVHHHEIAKLPTEISFEVLFDMVMFARGYGLQAPVRPWILGWMERLTVPWLDTKHYGEWLFITRVLELEKQYRLVKEMIPLHTIMYKEFVHIPIRIPGKEHIPISQKGLDLDLYEDMNQFASAREAKIVEIQKFLEQEKERFLIPQVDENGNRVTVCKVGKDSLDCDAVRLGQVMQTIHRFKLDDLKKLENVTVAYLCIELTKVYFRRVIFTRVAPVPVQGSTVPEGTDFWGVEKQYSDPHTDCDWTHRLRNLCTEVMKIDGINYV